MMPDFSIKWLTEAEHIEAKHEKQQTFCVKLYKYEANDEFIYDRK